MPRTLYRFIWTVSSRDQLWLCFLTGIVVVLSTAPLDIQRRIVDDAVAGGNPRTLVLLAAIYVALILTQGGVKYALNVARGRLVEKVTRALRLIIIERLGAVVSLPTNDRGTVVSMLSAETEDVGGFVGESISIPLLQGGTALAVIGYLVWVQPLIAVLAVVIYLPQLVIVPRVQNRINRFALLHAKLRRRLGDRVVRAGVVETAEQAAARRAAPKSRRPLDPHYTRIIDWEYLARVRLYKAKFFLTFLGNLLDAVGPLVVLIVGGLLVMQGTTQVSTLVVFISGFQRISDPWDQLVTFYRTVAIARVKYNLIARTIDGQDNTRPVALGRGVVRAGGAR